MVQPVKRGVLIGVLVLIAAVVWLLVGGEEPSASSVEVPPVTSLDEPPQPKAQASMGARVSGLVVREGKPVARARVTLRAAVPLVTLSMDDGRFLFEDIPSGQIYLSASAGDSASDVMGPLQVQPSSRLEDLQLTLLPALSIDGRVVDLLTQRPIAGATVVTPSQAGTTDAQGQFKVTGAKTQIWLDVSAPGFISRTEWVSLELARTGGRLDVVLTPSSRLEGTVTEAGNPVAAATVWAEVAEGARRGERSLIAFTDKEGKFSLECGAGSVQLAAVTPRGTRVKGPFVRVAVGEKKTGLVLDAAEVTTAEGVVQLSGQPLPGAQVTAIDAQTEELSGIGTSGPDGRFRFDSLVLGRYVVQVRANAITSSAGPFDHRGDGQLWQVQLQAGKVLQGRVQPKSAGVVVRWRSGSWSGPSAQTVTDAEGKFRFEGLPDEVVSLDAEGPAGAATARARAGTEVLLTLQKSEVIVHLKDERGGPVSDGLILARSLETGTTRRHQVLAPDGVARFDLPIGRWELSLEAGRGRSAAVNVDVTSAGAQAVLTLESTIVVTGKVIEKTSGLPISGARVEAVSGEFGRAMRVSVLTDARGEFQLPPVQRNSAVHAEREGFLGQWLRADVGGPLSFALDRPNAQQQQQLAQNGPPQFEGVGMTLDARQGPVMVVVVSEGSPAERAGVQAGDVILAVGGVPTAGQPLDAVVGRIRGPAGTPVVISFQRGGQSFELTMRRKLLNL